MKKTSKSLAYILAPIFPGPLIPGFFSFSNFHYSRLVYVYFPGDKSIWPPLFQQLVDLRSQSICLWPMPWFSPKSLPPCLCGSYSRSNSFAKEIPWANKNLPSRVWGPCGSFWWFFLNSLEKTNRQTKIYEAYPCM